MSTNPFKMRCTLTRYSLLSWQQILSFTSWPLLSREVKIKMTRVPSPEVYPSLYKLRLWKNSMEYFEHLYTISFWFKKVYYMLCKQNLGQNKIWCKGKCIILQAYFQGTQLSHFHFHLPSQCRSQLLKEKYASLCENSSHEEWTPFWKRFPNRKLQVISL